MITLILTLFLPACDFEDSDRCFWNARTMGNGTGTSFVSYEPHFIYIQQGQSQ